MARFSILKPRLQAAPARMATAVTASEQRITGRRLQARRLRMWQADPYCACCGTLVSLDGVAAPGFEVDHVVPLFEGGADVDGNCQILCTWRDERGRKAGCHAAKTAADLGHSRR